MSTARYSIKDLENFTKIKAHTIRIWEQRYGLLEPKRTNTNIRYYSEDDLKKILNINLLYNSGHKISKIASYDEAEIIAAAKSLVLESEKDKQSEIDILTLLILDFNGTKIKAMLKTEMERTSLVQMYESIVLPLLNKIGQLWHVNSINITHEHFFSNILKEFLITAIDAVQVTPDPLKSAILFLHDSEEHEFSILLYYYLLKKNGYTCRYFGQKVPINELELAYNQIKPQIVVTTFVAKISDKRFEQILKVLLRMAKDSQVIISGNQLIYSEFKVSKSILHIKSIDQLMTLLR